MQTTVLLVLVVIWLFIVSYFLYRIYKLFKNLTKSVEEDLTKKGFAEVRKRLDFLEDDGLKHIQKVGLVRFNPFRELGGDHSFSLAILDNKESGIILTSLHTRDRTRVYMKEVKSGKSEYELSGEEIKALNIAKKK